MSELGSVAFEFEGVTVVRAGRRVLDEVTAPVPAAGITVVSGPCMRDVGYRMITGGLRPDHAAIARFRARHEEALGGLFS